LHEPTLLLLDEPDTGLDLPAYQILEALLDEPRAGRTIVMATHNLQQAARVCSRGLVLVSGRLAADSPLTAVDAARLGELYGVPRLAARSLA
jgi:ABC-type multidrug transport system ATPase subunit